MLAWAPWGDEALTGRVPYRASFSAALEEAGS